MIIVKDEPLTESKKMEVYKYRGLFQAINKISKLIEELEELDKYIDSWEMERIIKDMTTELNKTINNESVNDKLEYARRKAYEDKPIWAGGDIERLYK